MPIEKIEHFSKSIMRCVKDSFFGKHWLCRSDVSSKLCFSLIGVQLFYSAWSYAAPDPTSLTLRAIGASNLSPVGQSIIGAEILDTRKLRRYNFSKAEGKWLPTPPGYMAAVEPYWNRIRTLTLDSAAECKPPPPPVFSKEKNTEFYEQALDVYHAVLNLSSKQRDIAMFWDCNPFYLNTQGHLNFATKKLSPGGHWMSIAGIAARKKNADLITSAAAYVVTAISLFDAFISCWDEKYRSNLIRPETYINSYIDEKWRPLLQTPPFPEYISGHSVISTAAAVALTDFFGDHFSFDDNTETYYGLPVRSFASFNEAAEEAAISRFYGGIHYRVAIVNGQQMGKLIGEKTLSRIRLLR